MWFRSRLANGRIRVSPEKCCCTDKRYSKLRSNIFVVDKVNDWPNLQRKYLMAMLR